MELIAHRGLSARFPENTAAVDALQGAGWEVTLLDLYREGLCRPLHFFPESSLAYAHKQEWNPGRARQRWEGSEYVAGEGRDPYFDLCFGRTDPFTAEFDRLAREILGHVVADYVGPQARPFTHRPIAPSI